MITKNLPTPLFLEQPRTISQKMERSAVLALVATAALALTISVANSAGFEVRQRIQYGYVPPQVTGIREAAPYEARGLPDYGPRPSAKILHVHGEVGPNRCGPHLFEVVNRSPQLARCFGY